MKILTLDILKQMKPETIFASGMFMDSPVGCNIANTGRMTPWIAKRGQIHDWTIYCMCRFTDSDRIMTNKELERVGDKIFSPHNIRKLVNCTDEAFEMYRQ